MNIVTIFLGISVGCTATANTFLNPQTLVIIVHGRGRLRLRHRRRRAAGQGHEPVPEGKINPLIGSAGVSAVPMAARVSQKVGQRENPRNFLLMHAMGPNVAGVIGSAIAAGILINIFGGHSLKNKRSRPVAPAAGRVLFCHCASSDREALSDKIRLFKRNNAERVINVRKFGAADKVGTLSMRVTLSN